MRPLLNGVVNPVTGLLNGLLAPASASPSPAPSLSLSPSPSSSSLSSSSADTPCVGVAASPSLLPELLP
ncbi:hypothetical protein [Streptomyces sp. NPDC057280]|uniref:hypothetical protein n=1 Tax=Streptomyces sp. NPDC057280 TaxID=3346081 RepID=UPI00364471C5